jgi:D-tyrosyl-tRNA(Tyr) deacylase
MITTYNNFNNSREDTMEDVNKIVPKILRIKLWNEGDTGWKKNVQDVNGGILAISQFTLYARTNKAKPDFHDAMKSEDALLLYNSFVDSLKSMHPNVQTGVFGQMMSVEIHNDGPVTIIIDSKE